MNHILNMEGLNNIKKGPYRSAFGDEEEDAPVYRRELMEKIQYGLGF